MTDPLHKPRTDRLSPENVEHYIQEAHRLRSTMLRDTARGAWRFIRQGI